MKERFKASRAGVEAIDATIARHPHHATGDIDQGKLACVREGRARPTIDSYGQVLALLPMGGSEQPEGRGPVVVDGAAAPRVPSRKPDVAVVGRKPVPSIWWVRDDGAPQ